MDPLIARVAAALLPIDGAPATSLPDDIAVARARRTGVIDGPLTPAAVLMPIIAHEDAPTVLFTRRSESLARHAGQISFPGGRVDELDRTAVDTALRECEEEIGLTRDAVRLLGALDPHETGSGYCVAPLVGWIAPPLSLTLDSNEVAAVLEVPLAFLIDRANHFAGTATFNDRSWPYTAIPYGEHRIWDITAGIIVNLCERLERAAGGGS